MEQEKKHIIIGAIVVAAIVCSIYFYRKNKQKQAADTATQQAASAISAQQLASQQQAVAAESAQESAQRAQLTKSLSDQIDGFIATLKVNGGVNMSTGVLVEAVHNFDVGSLLTADAISSGGTATAVYSTSLSGTAWTADQKIASLTKLKNTINANIMTLDELGAINNQFNDMSNLYVGTLSDADIQTAYNNVLNKYHIAFN